MSYYTTEDGKTVQKGDAAYDYYNMKPGHIGRDIDGEWFEFEHTDGTIDMLNGQRICGIEYAIKRGFKRTEWCEVCGDWLHTGGLCNA